MKKRELKILGFVGFVVCTGLLLKRMYDDKKKANVTAAVTAANISPETFQVADGPNTKRYWFHDGKYMTQTTGPLIKSIAVEISKADYDRAAVTKKA